MAVGKTGRLLGEGKEAEVYEKGDMVLKLYRAAASKASAFREAAILSIIENLGVAAPKVRKVAEIEGRWGVVMTRAEGGTFGEAMMSQAEHLQVYLAALVNLQRDIHAIGCFGLPGLKERLQFNIRRCLLIDEATRGSLLSGLAQMPDGDRLCHGDFHPWNVLGVPDRAVIVDWLDAASGDPAADVCRSYILMRHRDQAFAEAYAQLYAKVTESDPKAILRWLPYVAAARLSEDVPDEVEDLLRMVAVDPRG